VKERAVAKTSTPQPLGHVTEGAGEDELAEIGVDGAEEDGDGEFAPVVTVEVRVVSDPDIDVGRTTVVVDADRVWVLVIVLGDKV
jgi:hypothetical protein